LLNSADIQATLQLIGTNTPTIALSRVGDQVQIAYAGTLQLASALGGGWIDLTNAANPYIVDRSSAAKFFRARNVGGIFSSDEVVIFSMTGPLQEHFELAFAGLPDGIFPPVREKPWFEGTITIGQQSIPVEIRVRGNSSLQECPFPKLKFKVSRADRLGTPFYEAREVKIGTHCAEGGRGPIGRLRDERSAYREVLVYEMMQILEFLSPRVRRGRIEYQDTSTSRQNSEVGWSLMRNAMILDDVEVVAERLGGRALDDAEVAGLTNANFGLQLVTDLRVFQVLIGNWDYALTHDGVEVWNFDVVELPNLQLIPVAGDFDLSTFVTEEVNLDVPWDYHPELPPLERQARYDLEQINAGVSESGEGVFARAKERFESRRGLLEASIAEALIDEDGRTNAWTHLNAFYTALGAVSGTKGDQNTSRLQRVREGRVEVLP
jgi:hypothetical protein